MASPVGRALILCVAAALLAAASSGCALLSSICHRGQETGPVTAFSSTVPAGQTVTHVVPYDQEGTQNNVRVTWNAPVEDAALVRVYATSMECAVFIPPEPEPVRGPRTRRRLEPPRTPPPDVIYPPTPCTPLGAIQGREISESGLVQTRLSVPGGPEQGRPYLHRYRLHVVSSAVREVSYSITIRWWRGPDC